MRIEPVEGLGLETEIVAEVRRDAQQARTPFEGNFRLVRYSMSRFWIRTVART